MPAPHAPRAPPALQPVRVKGQILIPLPTALLALVTVLLLYHGAARSGGLGQNAASPRGVSDLGTNRWLDRAHDSWPVSRTLSCGNGTWQREYADLHAKMLRKEVPPRYIVAIGENGLADSFVGAVSLFWVAVLQRRAFFMSFGDSGGSYEWAFDQPSINWSWDKSLLADGDVRRFRLDSKKPNETEPMQICYGDVRQLGAEHTTLHVNTFKGYMRLLVDNTYHKEELRQMGLHPSNVLACGVDFLFRLKPEALAPHAEEFAELSDPATLKIGMHIRVGDEFFVRGQEHAPLDFYIAFFDCAMQLEAHRAVPGQEVRWYLLTDSVKLRRQAKERYGDKLVTKTDANVAHTRKNRGERQRADVIRSFQTAAAEMFMLSLTDYQIITTHSGYGRMGAFMSGKYHQVYGVEMFKDQQEPPANISCGVNNYLKRWNH